MRGEEQSVNHAGPVSLADLPAGAGGKIVDINAGARLRRRLEAMGLRLGSEVTKICGLPLNGPVVVQARATRIGLGHGMAGKVMVEAIKNL